MRRLIAKCVLSVAKGGAQETCGNDQLCKGLPAGKKGGVHAMHLAWETHKMDVELGFLLIRRRFAFETLRLRPRRDKECGQWPGIAYLHYI